ALANAKRERRGLQRERLGLSYRPVRVKPHLQLVLTRCQVPREEAASIIPVVASTELERRRAQKALSWSHWVSPPLGPNPAVRYKSSDRDRLAVPSTYRQLNSRRYQAEVPHPGGIGPKVS